jgi:methylthioribose-1-phosphate isomerase
MCPTIVGDSVPITGVYSVTSGQPIVSIRWNGDIDGHLELLDQTLLPTDLEILNIDSVDALYEAIVSLRVRGAPAIGIAAAYGVVIGVQSMLSQSVADAAEETISVCRKLAQSRPTAVNLFWALDRMEKTAQRNRHVVDARSFASQLLREARVIHDEDRQMCHAIGRYGAQLLRSASGVLTHCNTGGLATSEYGTALSAIFTAQDEGHVLHVYADETRPLLQGARLTAWELHARQIPCTLICDSMAAQVMREGRVQAVIVGADRITARGDTANKIGTYGLAVLAKHHNIPFIVAAPTSTFDLSIIGGDSIPIEQRRWDEITHGFGKQTAPAGIGVYNPAFDVTPAELISAIVTERGIIDPVDESMVRQVLGVSA